jgi:hypothetical protein
MLLATTFRQKEKIIDWMILLPIILIIGGQ